MSLSLYGAGTVVLAASSLLMRGRKKKKDKRKEDFIVIGITGTIGSGKGTVVEYLKKKKHFEHYSARAYLYELLDKKGLERNRDNLTVTANALRAKEGPAAVAVALFRRAREVGKNAIIESLRTEGEIASLRSKKMPFVLLAVDADPKVRYERIRGRGSKTDDVSFVTFLAQEKREMTSTDPTKQNLARCMELADHKIVNNGSVEAFHAEIERVLSKLL